MLDKVVDRSRLRFKKSCPHVVTYFSIHSGQPLVYCNSYSIVYLFVHTYLYLKAIKIFHGKTQRKQYFE